MNFLTSAPVRPKKLRNNETVSWLAWPKIRWSAFLKGRLRTQFCWYFWQKEKRTISSKTTAWWLSKLSGYLLVVKQSFGFKSPNWRSLFSAKFAHNLIRNAARERCPQVCLLKNHSAFRCFQRDFKETLLLIFRCALKIIWFLFSHCHSTITPGARLQSS